MKMSLPMMMSMLIQALYNVVDSIFVARYSEAALTAVSLAFPLQNLIIAFAVGTGVGINSILARRLGEKREDLANMAANTGVFLAFITFVVFAFIGLFFARPFLSIFTEDPELLELALASHILRKTIVEGLEDPSPVTLPSDDHPGIRCNHKHHS